MALAACLSLLLTFTAGAEEDGAEEIEKLNQHVAELYRAGRYQEALTPAKQAVQWVDELLGPDHPEMATSLNSLAGIYFAMGDYARAEPLLERSLAIREKTLGPEHPEVAGSLNNLAGLYNRMGDYARAEPFYKRSLEISEKALGPEHPGVATSLNGLSNVYFIMGDYARTEPLLERSLAIREKTLGPEHPKVAESLNNLAYLYAAMGDYARAEPLVDRSLAILEKTLGPEHPELATSLNNLAGLYDKMGDYARAEALYQRSLAISEKALGPDHPDVAASLSGLAGLRYRMTDYAHAKVLIERSVAILEMALGPEHPGVAPSLTGLAVVYYSMGDDARAKVLLERSVAILEKTLGPEHPDVAASLNNLAALYHGMGDYARAEPLYERSLAIWEKTLGPEHPDLAKSLNGLAFLSWAAGDGASALVRFAEAAAIEETQIELVLAGLPPARAQAYMATLPPDLLISFQAAVPTSTGARRLAFETLLRRKGRILDASVRGTQALRRSLSEGDAAALQTLLERRARLAALVLRGPGEQPVERYGEMLDGLRAEVDQVETLAMRRGKALSRALMPVTLDAVQGSLPTNAALIEFVAYRPFEPRAEPSARWGPERYGAFVLRGTGEPAWVDLGKGEEIAASAAVFRKALLARQVPAAAGAGTPARALYTAVMAPLEAYLGGVSHLLVAPDGVLNLIPFAALRSGEGDDAHYLIEQRRITYLTSGRDLIRLAEATPERAGPLVVAAPDYAANGAPATVAMQAEATRRRSRDLHMDHWPPLPGTRKEGELLGKLLGVKPRLGRAARESAVKQAAGPRILHLATHAFFLADEHTPVPVNREAGFALPASAGSAGEPAPGESPLLRSGLVLAGADHLADGSEDGVLTALEVAGLDLTGTQLVMLSACDTGIGELANGEGVYGLRRALVIAGSASQVTTLWKIDDDATVRFVERYYERLLAGEGRSEALRQVQLELLKSPVFSHPYYWAGFVPSGAWGPLPPRVEDKANATAAQ